MCNVWSIISSPYVLKGLVCSVYTVYCVAHSIVHHSLSVSCKVYIIVYSEQCCTVHHILSTFFCHTQKTSRACLLTERTKILYPSTLLSIFSIFKLSSIHIIQSALLGNTATNCTNTQDTHGHFVLLVNNFITSLFH